MGRHRPQARRGPIPCRRASTGTCGSASRRSGPFIGGGYYHPGNWRKRLDFGTGTFGDMGCHILDPVFGALGVGNPLSIRSERPGPNDDNWALDVQVKYVFPGTEVTRPRPSRLTWYNGNVRPPEDRSLGRPASKLDPDQGSIYIGEKGVMYSPYVAQPILLPADKFAGFKMPEVKGDDHYLQFVEAVRGNGKTSTPFSYSGPLTEMVLLGCLATRFEKTGPEVGREGPQVHQQRRGQRIREEAVPQGVRGRRAVRS